MPRHSKPVIFRVDEFTYDYRQLLDKEATGDIVTETIMGIDG